MTSPEPRLAFKVWLETKGKYVFGRGAFEVLSKVDELGSLAGAARALGMSYRKAWGIVDKIKKRTGWPMLKTHRGGKQGGESVLTEEARALLKEYSKILKAFEGVSRSQSVK